MSSEGTPEYRGEPRHSGVAALLRRIGARMHPVTRGVLATLATFFVFSVWIPSPVHGLDPESRYWETVGASWERIELFVSVAAGAFVAGAGFLRATLLLGTWVVLGHVAFVQDWSDITPLEVVQLQWHELLITFASMLAGMAFGTWLRRRTTRSRKDGA